MSLSESKCCYSNNYLHFLKRVVPLLHFSAMAFVQTTHFYSPVLRLVHTSDVGLAFLMRIAISIDKFQFLKIATVSDSDIYVIFSHLCKYPLRPWIYFGLVRKWDIFQTSTYVKWWLLQYISQLPCQMKQQFTCVLSLRI